MADEWLVRCKDCAEAFGYSDWSYRESAARGLSRPERCSKCRRVHNRQVAAMGMAYFELTSLASSELEHVSAGRLGRLDHEAREHRRESRSSSFDPGKFGVTDDDVRRLFEWLKSPNHQVAVVVGPTGSGKSTALPYRLISPPDGVEPDQFTRYGQVVVTQPRIQATRNIPAYVAKDLYGSSIGCGYDIGFRYSNHPYSDWRNRLVYVTDGTLINWIVNGQVAKCSLIMIDEAHERSLNIDLILGLLKKTLPRYPHLRLVIASATIDSDLFADYFGRDSTAIIEFQEKRKYRVEEHYRSEETELPYHDIAALVSVLPDAVASRVVGLLDDMERGDLESGDVLAFLQGEKPILATVNAIRSHVESNELLRDSVDVYPLFTTLPQEEQNKALLKKDDPTRLRVVVTTNVAETSLTVEGVVYVVDSGVINQSNWDSVTQTRRVGAVLHSKAGCRQRWGRAGRVRDGMAYCLYSRQQFDSLFPEYTVPEIQRSPLDKVVLAAKAAGVDDVAGFDWIEAPPPGELARAPAALRELGALDAEGDLTDHGLVLQRFPDEPVLANVMVMADRFACAVEAATLLAMVKAGGARKLLRYQRDKWTADTKRAVWKIHEAMKHPCQDDVEFLLKLYVAWSEGSEGGKTVLPREALHDVWPSYVPPLPVSMREALGEDQETVFIEEATRTIEREKLVELVEKRAPECDAGEWLMAARNALAKAEREAWSSAFFVRHDLLVDAEAERESLLESLSGHTKHDDRREIDFDLLGRLRIVLAGALPGRRYSETGGVHEPKGSRVVPDAGAEQSDGSQPVKPIVAVSYDSVCAERPPKHFVATLQNLFRGKNEDDIPKLYVSGLSRVEPGWVAWLDDGQDSFTSVARFIAEETRLDGELISAPERANLFIDQLYPIGSRYKCRVAETSATGAARVELTECLSGLPRVRVEYACAQEEGELNADGNEPRGSSPGELADTVLTAGDVVVSNLEEDEEPFWSDLAGHGQDDGDPAAASLPVAGSADLRFELLAFSADKASSPELTAEVSGFDLADPQLPVVLLRAVPEVDPFDVFSEAFEVGSDIELVAVGVDERPGDREVSLLAREAVSGLEVLLDPAHLAGLQAKSVSPGTHLRCRLAAVDVRARAVDVEVLDSEWDRLVAVRYPVGTRVADTPIRNVVDDLGAFVEIEPGLQCLLRTGKTPASMDLRAGDTISVCISGVDRGQCRLELDIAEAPPSPAQREFVTSCELGTIVTGQVCEIGDDGASVELKQGVRGLLCDCELNLTKGPGVRARKALRVGSSLVVKVIGKDIDAGTLALSLRHEESFPVGSWQEGRVTNVTDFGVFVELAPGASGLIHKSELSDGFVAHPSEVVSAGESVRVRVLRYQADGDFYKIDLSLKNPEETAGMVADSQGIRGSACRACAGWHPDPLGRHELRYWDGEQWTPHVSDRGVPSLDGNGL